MNILDLFKKKSYKDSPRRETYEEIAKLLDTDPQHVYKIAHGKRPIDVKDDKIITQLIIRGIIH